jgi:hypothetical protein
VETAFDHHVDPGAEFLPPPRILHPYRTNASTFAPEAGAQCVRSARWDLCGGPAATPVPTAIAQDTSGERYSVLKKSLTNAFHSFG